MIVSTVRALKYHGSLESNDETEQLKIGVSNLDAHVSHLKKYEIPFVIALNQFDTDTKADISFMLEWAKANGYPVELATMFKDGSKGGIALAKRVVELCEVRSTINYTYELTDDLFTKTLKVAKRMYGANDVLYSKKALNKLTALNETYKDLQICIAKTPLSFSDDAKKRGLIHDFDLNIADVRLSRGAGFVVLLTKGIITMPGLPLEPNAKKMFIDDDGIMSGKI